MDNNIEQVTTLDLLTALHNTQTELEHIRKMISTMTTEYILLLSIYAQVMMIQLPNATQLDVHQQLNERMHMMQRAIHANAHSLEDYRLMCRNHIDKHWNLASSVTFDDIDEKSLDTPEDNG